MSTEATGDDLYWNGVALATQYTDNRSKAPRNREPPRLGHLFSQRGIGEFLEQFSRHEKHTGLLLGKNHRRKMVALSEKITDSRFGTQWHTGFFQSTDITVHGPYTDTETVGNLFCFDNAFGLKMDENGCEAVDTIHCLPLSYP